ncbi:CLUMA_CG006158, isoform A [Clunio marinus]|uniref:CLUMA_CG006158, isoform A n=1 Tax=Clunio marinus TaxID=568069 RepID=A0A1J1HWZ7_9DIPT|nr:CLUMA_CG006158, isoform A [Clunio marinus]
MWIQMCLLEMFSCSLHATLESIKSISRRRSKDSFWYKCLAPSRLKRVHHGIYGDCNFLRMKDTFKRHCIVKSSLSLTHVCILLHLIEVKMLIFIL